MADAAPRRARASVTAAATRSLASLGCLLALLSGCSSATGASTDASSTDAPDPTLDRLRVPGATFMMGCTDPAPFVCPADELPVHAVTVSSFLLDRTEVTQAAYARCVDAGACLVPTSLWDPVGHADHPVWQVPWTQADAYCRWRGMRLPTEAEWELAARGGDGRLYPWGDEAIDCTRGNFDGCNGPPDYTTRVGAFPAGAGPFGHLDLGGSLWEWCSDWYAPDAYATSAAVDPTGPASSPLGHRVKRGGSWRDRLGRAAYRNHHPVDLTGSDDIGFRCARSAP